MKEAQKSAENLVEDRDSFKVSFDVSKFKPEEITIRSEDGELVVEGRQEVKSDEGYSTRHFVRAYSLPRNIDRDSFKSRLSKDGILSIEAKKLQQAEAKDNYIKIEKEEVDWNVDGDVLLYRPVDRARANDSVIRKAIKISG